MNDLRTRLRAIVAKEMVTDSAHDLAHLDRVWHNAGMIAEDEPGVDTTVLLAAAYLHDLVNLPKNHPDGKSASRQSAQKAAPILHSLGLSADQVHATRHAIEAHSYSAGIPPETAEACILRDADRLDALGTIGIARNFAVSATFGQSFYDPDDPFAQRRPLDDKRFAVDHWKLKLLHLQDGMLTDRGRELAQRRTGILRRFLDDFADEIGVPLPPEWGQA